MKRRMIVVAIVAFLMLFMACNPETPVQYHKVSYIGTDGKIMVSHEVESGKTDMPPKDPVKEGYFFKGWSINEDGEEFFNFNTPITGDITLFPIWGETCKINYIYDEDVVGAPEDVTVDIYTVVEAPENPSKSGYDFKGWKTDLMSEEYFSFGSITSDVTLYPVFEGKEMTVNFIYEDKESLGSKTYRTGDVLTPSSLGIGLDDSIFTWELVDDSTKESYELKTPLPYIESGYTFVAHISSSYMSVDEEGAISGSEDLKAKNGPYTLIIPRYLNRKEVKAIKEKAFYSDGVENSPIYSFDKLILPDTLTSIGNSAFTSCIKLIELDIPSSVTSIGVYAFADCSSLKKVVLHEGIEDIGRGSFCDCVNLIEISLPSSIITISTDVFSRCGSLESITLPKNITSVSERCFTGCSSLINISFEGTIKKIEEEAFSNCESLTSFDIPDSVTSIGEKVFLNCSKLKKVTLSNGITSLSIGIFTGCSSLTSIEIPSTVTSIGDSAFYDCSGLKSINIPSSVESIGNSAFTKSGLESIVIPEKVTSIGEGAFQLCSNLTTITFNGQNLTSIAANTFKECEKLTSITLPDSVTSIGDYAFYLCPSLSEIYFGSGVKTISFRAFKQSGLTSISIPGNVKSIGEEAFSNCSRLGNVTLYQYQGLESIGPYSFEGCSVLAKINIPNSVTSIGNRAFQDCTSLSNITLGSGITEIPDGEFYGCSSLESIFIPSNVTTIANNAFNECKQLKEIRINNSINTIYDSYEETWVAPQGINVIWNSES